MLKKNILYNTILQISQLLFPLITFPYAARVLHPSAIGTVNFASNFTQYFLTFALLGIPAYGIREIAKVADNKLLLKKTFSELFLFNLITTAIVSTIFLIVIVTIPSLKTDMMLFLIGFGILWSNLFFIEWYFNGTQEFKYITIRSLIIRSVAVLLIFILIKSPEDRNLYYFIEFFVIAVSAIFNFSKASSLLDLNIKAKDLKKHTTPILTLFSLSVMITIYVYANTIILGFYKPKTEVAFYTVSEKISKLAVAFIKTSGIVLLPQLSVLLNNNNNIDQKRAKSLLKKSFHYTTFLSIPIAFGVFIFSKELINAVAGTDYAAADLSLQILSPLPILLGLAFIYSRQILFPLGKEKQMFKLSIYGMSFNLIINFILIPKMGYIGSSITYLLTEVVMVLLVYFESRKYLRIKVGLAQTAKTIILSSMFYPIYLMISKFSQNPFVVLISGIASCLVFYSFIQLMLKDQTAVDIYNFITGRASKKTK